MGFSRNCKRYFIEADSLSGLPGELGIQASDATPSQETVVEAKKDIPKALCYVTEDQRILPRNMGLPFGEELPEEILQHFRKRILEQIPEVVIAVDTLLTILIRKKGHLREAAAWGIYRSIEARELRAGRISSMTYQEYLGLLVWPTEKLLKKEPSLRPIFSSTKIPKTRGRKVTSNIESDTRVAQAWRTNEYERIEGLAAAFSISPDEARRVLDRHRQREKRANKSS